ncbi:MAG: winged helix-turn-helix domain-containing protein, partial [Gammaproteobacteria bacterium]|nr:winged helix-turn-helix domain-containing protein [Gammaproteobacteria bacterium]
NLVTKQELIDEVWDGRPTSDEPIARCLSQLRGHLDDRQKPHKLIETLQRRGYRLNQRVELHQPATAETLGAVMIEPGPSSRVWKMVAAILAVGFVATMAISYWSPGPQPHSIAVMPFKNLSGNESDEYLVLGFKEELVTTLQGLPKYTVKNVRGTYKEEDAEIAEMLGVANLLYGTLQRNGDDLKISYQISNEGDVVHGGSIEGSVLTLFNLQESVALMVRDKLVGKSAQMLIKSRPSDSQAYDSYMRGMYALEHRGSPGNLENAIDLFQNAIENDASYGPSYLALATVYTLLPYYRNAPLEEMDRLALETVENGVAADPIIADAAGAIYGYVYHKQKRWEESEAAFLRAVNAEVVDSNAFNWYSRMLASVGRLDDSLTLILSALEIDPSSPVINSRTAMSYAWVGNEQKALEYYERANALGWRGPVHILGYAFILIQTGQIRRAQELAMATVQEMGASTDWVGPVFDAFADPSKSAAALEALNAVAAQEPVAPVIELTVRAMLGDLDGAMRIAERLEEPGEVFQMDMLFIPELAELRRHPGFMPLMGRLGISAYWSSKGCTWKDDHVNCESVQD